MRICLVIVIVNGVFSWIFFCEALYHVVSMVVSSGASSLPLDVTRARVALSACPQTSTTWAICLAVAFRLWYVV